MTIVCMYQAFIELLVQMYQVFDIYCYHGYLETFLLPLQSVILPLQQQEFGFHLTASGTFQGEACLLSLQSWFSNILHLSQFLMYTTQTHSVIRLSKTGYFTTPRRCFIDIQSHARYSEHCILRSPVKPEKYMVLNQSLS